MKICARLCSCLFVFLPLISGIAVLPERAAAQITVNLATPNNAVPGTVALNVVVNGSGFKKGAKAQWFVTGTTNPGGVTVNSTAFNNSGQLTANITVSSTATLANFDIQVVNWDGRTGKGTELFAVVASGSGPTGSCTAQAAAAPGLYPTRDYCVSGGGGCLDTSFGTGGFAIQSALGPTQIKMQGSQIVAFDGANPGATVDRFNSDGSLDTTFGTNGSTFVTSSNSGQYWDKIVVQPNGYILVLSGPVLARLTPNGQFDTSFGTSGTVQLTMLSAGALAIQSDGKILLGGSGGRSSYWAVTRLTSSGSLDQSFGSGGTAIFNTGPQSSSSGAIADVAVQKVNTSSGVEERIVGAGYAGSSHSGEQLTIARLLTNGAIDSSFGTSAPGVTRFNASIYNQTTSVAIDSANRIVAGNQVEYNGCLDGIDYFIVRSSPNGLPDNTFGDVNPATNLRTGTTHVNFYGKFDHFRGLVVDAFDRPVATGTATTQSGSSFLAVVRLNVDGTPDITFGDHGAEVLDFGGAASAGVGITLQPDGRIILTGGPDGHDALSRLWP